VPEPAHTVVVAIENHSYAGIAGNPAAPFINDLARRGALFTRSYAITHPSEPNYLALFSGSTQGVADDGCPYRFAAPNLAADLMKAGRTFAGYSEDLPGPGSPVCSAGDYARKHVPWAIIASRSLVQHEAEDHYDRGPAVDLFDGQSRSQDGWVMSDVAGRGI